MRTKCYPMTSNGWDKALKDLHKQQDEHRNYIIAGLVVCGLFVSGIVKIGFVEKYAACNITSKVVKWLV